MAVRTSMAMLIARLRRLIGDPAGAAQTWDDLSLQDALDARVLRVTAESLRVEPALIAGATQYLAYAAVWGDWEDGARLVSGAYQPLTPATSDPIAGRWTFASSTPPPVLISGATYDLAAAAADVLEQWAALVARCVTSSAGTQRIQLSDQSPALLRLADQYRRRARPLAIRQQRADLADDVNQLRDDRGITRLLGTPGSQYY